MKFIIFIILICINTFLVLGKTLNFSLFGDDWFAIYRYILDFPTFISHFSLSSYINDHSNYNFADLFMGIIYRVFYINPFPYYLVSMMIRIATALSFYFAISCATKNKLAGYLSALLFSVMFAGIETTNWVFNMNTYVSMILFNIFIYLYIKFHKFTLLTASVLGILLGLSFIITPNRMHGLLFAIPLIALWKLKGFSKQNLIRLIPLIMLLYLPIMGFRFLISSTNDISYGETLSTSITNIRLFKSILGSIANAAIPEKVYEYFGVSQNLKVSFIVFVLTFLIVFFVKARKSFPEISKFALLSLSIILSFIIMPLLVFDPQMIINSDHRYLFIPGAFMMVIYACLFVILWKNKSFLKTSALMFIALIFLLNIFSLQNYFDYLSKEGRMAKDSQKYFDYIKTQITRPNNNAPMPFLFITDNPIKLHNSITFGFPYRMMLTDERFGLDAQKSPFAVDYFESLVNIVSTPNSSELKRYGYQPVKIPLENVYFFKFENSILTNVTEEGRKLLIEKGRL